jgi:prolyl-tRNA editing enzyme YbaK/EbsC (Cys-tRNA(Pro) deacylase)
MDAWTPQHLQAYLDQHQIAATILHLPQATLTVPDAADALGVPVEQIVKTVLFLVEGQAGVTAYAVLANGTRRVDRRKLAAHLSVNRKKIKLAEGPDVIALTGYAPGAVPPIVHRQPMAMLMTEELQAQETVYAGGGGGSAMLQISTATLQQLTQPTILSLLEDPAGEADG